MATMSLTKHLTIRLLLLTVLTASGLASASFTSGIQNFTGGLNQEKLAANALMHQAKTDSSYDAASGYPIVTRGGGRALIHLGVAGTGKETFRAIDSLQGKFALDVAKTLSNFGLKFKSRTDGGFTRFVGPGSSRNRLEVLVRPNGQVIRLEKFGRGRLAGLIPQVMSLGTISLANSLTVDLMISSSVKIQEWIASDLTEIDYQAGEGTAKLVWFDVDEQSWVTAIGRDVVFFKVSNAPKESEPTFVVDLSVSRLSKGSLRELRQIGYGFVEIDSMPRLFHLHAEGMAVIDLVCEELELTHPTC